MPAKKRSKSLKSMTVAELVKERQKHSDKINQIDEILQKASEALGQKVVETTPMYRGSNAQVVNQPVQPGSIGATAVPNRKYTQTAPVSLHPPSVNPIGYGTKDDIAPAFSLFDADADARMRASQEAEVEDKLNGDYSDSIDNKQLKEETDDLKEQLAKELNNINDIPMPEAIEGQRADS